jgi:hypothetical protein
MRVLLALVVLLLVTGCVSQPRRSAETLIASLDQPYYGEASDAGKDAGVNYRILMQRAVKRDPVALRRLIHLCTDRHFDGAALEVHAQYLRDLLELWGDAPFAGGTPRFVCGGASGNAVGFF